MGILWAHTGATVKKTKWDVSIFVHKMGWGWHRWGLRGVIFVTWLKHRYYITAPMDEAAEMNYRCITSSPAHQEQPSPRSLVSCPSSQCLPSVPPRQPTTAQCPLDPRKPRLHSASDSPRELTPSWVPRIQFPCSQNPSIRHFSSKVTWKWI